MRIDFYGSNLCPRCKKVQKHLKELEQDFPNLQVNFIEVITSPIKTMKNGICMIPALKTENQKLSGVFLSKEQIKTFLQKEQDARQ